MTYIDVTGLLMDAASLDGDTVAQVYEDHQFIEFHAGDGYTEPREAWIECSCGDIVWSWQQYYMETTEDAKTNKELHLSMMLVSEALKNRETN